MKIEIYSKVKVELSDVLLGMQELPPKQKVKIASKLSNYSGAIDMTYVEDALKELSKIYLKRIKTNRELYNRNRPFFKALKTITKTKTVE